MEQLGSVLFRSHAQFIIQQTDTFIELANGGCLLAIQRVQLHEPAMSRFLQWIERQPPPSVFDSHGIFSYFFKMVDKRSKQLCQNLAQLLAPEELPIVNLWAVI